MIPQAVTAIACQRCGAQSGPAARYCANCGSEVAHSLPPTERQPPAQRSGTSVPPPRLSVAPPPPRERHHADPLIGRIVADRYRVLELIGRGGMGVVYRAEHARIGKILALKLLTGELTRDPGQVARFKREALMASKLSHPNTVQVFDFGDADGLAYLAMEYVRGTDLGSVGKTLMGLHFLASGATTDGPGILLTLQESSSQLERIARGFGWSLPNPMITVMDRSPVDVLIDELVYDILELIDATRARRVVIDSLNDLAFAAPDAVRFREFSYSLVRRLANAGISVMFTLEVPELFRISRLSDLGLSHIADNVVLLQHLHSGDQMKRALTVLKTRGSSHVSTVREFQITPDGITLGSTLDLQALLR
jgi:KaiC/GvpD/RAD55 family RecA-like ATPase